MHVFIVIVGLLASILLIGSILLQSPKSGSGLAGGMSGLGTVQTLGVRRTGDFLSKTTGILAGIVMILCFIAQFTLPGKKVTTAAPESRVMQMPSADLADCTKTAKAYGKMKQKLSNGTGWRLNRAML